MGTRRFTRFHRPFVERYVSLGVEHLSSERGNPRPYRVEQPQTSFRGVRSRESNSRRWTNVRNQWAGLFEPFKPRVQQWQSPDNPRQNPRPENERIQQPIKLIAQRIRLIEQRIRLIAQRIQLIAQRIQPAERRPEKLEQP